MPFTCRRALRSQCLLMYQWSCLRQVLALHRQAGSCRPPGVAVVICAHTHPPTSEPSGPLGVSEATLPPVQAGTYHPSHLIVVREGTAQPTARSVGASSVGASGVVGCGSGCCSPGPYDICRPHRPHRYRSSPGGLSNALPSPTRPPWLCTCDMTHRHLCALLHPRPGHGSRDRPHHKSSLGPDGWLSSSSPPQSPA